MISIDGKSQHMLTLVFVKPIRLCMATDLTDLANYDTPLFPVRVAAAVAGIEAGTLRIWYLRNHLTLGPDDAAAARDGMAHSLTFRSVLHIALTASLASKGVKIPVAFQAAMRWIHMGGMSFPDLGITDYREPAGLYPGDDWTLFIHFSDTDAKVTRAPLEGNRLCIDLGDIVAAGSAGPTVIFLNPLVERARHLCRRYLGGDLKDGRSGRANG